MSTSKRLLHFLKLARVQRVYACTRYVSFIPYVDTTTAAAVWYSYIQYSGTIDWYCFFLLLAAVVIRLFAQDRDSGAWAVLWCTSGLASKKHFAIVPSDIFEAYLFIYLYSVFFRHGFLQPEPTLAGFAWSKQKQEHAWYVRVICVHIRTHFFFFFSRFYFSSFWTSCGLRCRPFFPPVRAFSFYLA